MIRKRPDIPNILPSKHARPSLRRVIADRLRNTDRPWSIAVDLLVLAGFTVALCWEVWEFGLDGEWEHMAIACVFLAAGVVYAFRAFTTDREDHR